MSTRENLVTVCETRLKERGLDQDQRYVKRLKWELEEILARNKEDYFWNLYSSKTRYPQNQNNLLVVWLLDICKDYNIEQDPNCEYGEYPDIDIDYLSQVRDYLKNEWAKVTFGEDYVCNIGNYTTFGIKSALIDMARVHGEPRDEILNLTKSLEAKDDEGKALTWDAAMKLYPDLKKYCDAHPPVAEAARRLLNRNRGMGVHAGGLIISSIPLSDLVPLVKRKDNPQASAWVEGLHGQDLQPVGLVKFDLLVISNLIQIAYCCELVKKRHGLTNICALPGQSDWSDVPAWRNDKKALAMASMGDLKCIFQFDSEGIRNLVRAGGVDSFEDLVAYTALFRPGPLGMRMQERYIKRKRGQEKYELHPLLKPILEKTYGVITYQEQVMRILNVVGNIPLKDCEAVRKAISKKKVEGFIKYKEMFIRNGQSNLGVAEQEATLLWNQIEAFAEYGFNLSHAVAYTYISSRLLYLKAHYPHEFYAAILKFETLSDKIKEYKMEAKLHGVDMHRLDANKSKVAFELVGDTIYYGFSNVKGIGEAPAEKIVAAQPYQSFEDFLHRYGTDASTLKPLIGLRVFRDADPVTLWKFTEYYKGCAKKMEDKRKRYVAAMERYEAEFQELVPGTKIKLTDLVGEQPFDAPAWQVYDVKEEIEVDIEVECGPDEGGEERVVVEPVELDDGFLEIEKIKYYKMGKGKRPWNRLKELKKLWDRRKKTIERYESSAKQVLPQLASFDANAYEIDDEVVKELRNPTLCEEKYYGFPWVHDIERSPDYKGNLTFDNLKSANAAGHDTVICAVEIRIEKVSKKKGKKVTYYQIEAQDVTGEKGKINVWQNDYERWQQELVAGNLVRIRLQPPSGGYATYLLEGNETGRRWGELRYKQKEDDPRVLKMRPGDLEEEKYLTTEEVMSSFDACVSEENNG